MHMHEVVNKKHQIIFYQVFHALVLDLLYCKLVQRTGKVELENTSQSCDKIFLNTSGHSSIALKRKDKSASYFLKHTQSNRLQSCPCTLIGNGSQGAIIELTERTEVATRRNTISRNISPNRQKSPGKKSCHNMQLATSQ